MEHVLTHRRCRVDIGDETQREVEHYVVVLNRRGRRGDIKLC